MATAKPPYDPVKSIEGMFNGSITRIGYMLKDPANFGQGTKAVLEECSKRFQDALDDCEIQLLDAKWYLEHLLAQNKAKREAKSREESAVSAKRKHDEIKEVGDKEGRDEDAKRKKTEAEVVQEPNNAEEQPKQDLALPSVKTTPPTTSPDVPKKAPSEEKPNEKPTEVPQPKPEISKPKVQINTSEKKSDLAPPDSQPQTAPDEFPKATPQVTPAATNDDFNFVSMFGEPSGEAGEEATNDMDFDLNLGDDFANSLNDPNNTNMEVPSSLSSLLPGLESYASHAGDDNVFGTGDGSANNQATINNFDLPNLVNNDFDDFLNANDFDSTNFNNNMNLNDDTMMNMDSMDNIENVDNMDFDSMFS